MILELPRFILICLAVTTILGVIMGYCVAMIRAKGLARSAIEKAHSEHLQAIEASHADRDTARKVAATERRAARSSRERAEQAIARQDALEVHAQLQAQRIRRLEAEVSVYEDKQMRLQRDFASYKSNKTRELEWARNTSESWSDSWVESEQLPVLNKRVEAVPASSENLDSLPRNSVETTSLSLPLSRELDIPALAESELPDSVDELDFELADMQQAGTPRRE